MKDTPAAERCRVCKKTRREAALAALKNIHCMNCQVTADEFFTGEMVAIVDLIDDRVLYGKLTITGRESMPGTRGELDRQIRALGYKETFIRERL